MRSQRLVAVSSWGRGEERLVEGDKLLVMGPVAGTCSLCLSRQGRPTHVLCKACTCQIITSYTLHKACVSYVSVKLGDTLKIMVAVK